MIKVKLLLPAALCIVMLVSCDLLPDIDQISLAEEDSFYAQNMETGEYYNVRAEMLYDGSRCVIWAEKSAKVTTQTAREIAREYDTVIRPKIVDTFSKKDFYTSEGAHHFDDMLDYANWLVGGKDKKLTVLLLDIKDGFKDPKTDSYVAGYFSGVNFFEGRYSNGRDMIYVDTYPGLEKRRQAYATFAHELQHLINFVTTLQMDRYLMDEWVDEGLSSQAEFLCYEEKQSKECEWFIDDREGTIARGNNFFVWDNHSEKSLAILDDYATVYLFFRWLYLQADEELQSHIFLDIETSEFHGYRAVTSVAQQINPAWKDWETLLGTWLAANYYPRNSYGYTGDSYLQKTIKVNPIPERTILLDPGEGVYSIINNPFSAVTSGNIRYAGLAVNEPTIGTSSPYTGNTLLTFNANTDYTAEAEPGNLTGVRPPDSPTAARNAQTGTSTGPYVIDARDMLKRAGKR